MNKERYFQERYNVLFVFVLSSDDVISRLKCIIYLSIYLSKIKACSFGTNIVKLVFSSVYNLFCKKNIYYNKVKIILLCRLHTFVTLIPNVSRCTSSVTIPSCYVACCFVKTIPSTTIYTSWTVFSRFTC